MDPSYTHDVLGHLLLEHTVPDTFFMMSVLREVQSPFKRSLSYVD